MFFTSLRKNFLKSTGIRSAGFICNYEEDLSSMTWLEATYRKDIRAWQVKDHCKTQGGIGPADTHSYVRNAIVNFEDAIKILKEFEAEQSNAGPFDRWDGDRNIEQAESVLRDQKYSLRHRIMNIGLPKL